MIKRLGIETLSSIVIPVFVWSRKETCIFELYELYENGYSSTNVLVFKKCYIQKKSLANSRLFVSIPRPRKNHVTFKLFMQIFFYSLVAKPQNFFPNIDGSLLSLKSGSKLDWKVATDPKDENWIRF